MGVTVRLRGKVWWVFIHHHGQRKAKPAGDRDAALRVAKDIRERLLRRDFHLPGADTPTVRAYSVTWLVSVKETLKASTQRFYKGHLDQHIVPFLGDRPVVSLRRSDCRDLVVACRAKGLSVITVRGIARTLSSMLSQAVEDELLPANPALRLGKYLRRGDEAEPVCDPFTKDEAAQLVTVARHQMPDWAAWVLCGLRTGLRAGELLALQWSDVNWRRGFVQVQRNLVRGHLTTPKNHQRRRVDLSYQLQAALRLWRRYLRRIWLQAGAPMPAWIFPSVTGTALDESNVRKAFNRLLDLAELHRRGPKQMRHTFASRLLQDRAPITYVSQQLGHKDASVTLRVYAHWLPDATGEKLVNLLDDAQLDATPALQSMRAVNRHVQIVQESGEPRRNRTFNPQIKSRLRKAR